MLIEIPDVIVIIGVIIAFVVGVVGVYAYHRISQITKPNGDVLDAGQNERLEYYERQLIDMKIRLDAMEIQGTEHKTADKGGDLRHFIEELVKDRELGDDGDKTGSAKMEPKKIVSGSNIERLNTMDYVLHLITQHDMTSRDIKITLNKSREHTARLMKELFEEGYVERRAGTKPFVYSITEKGKERVKQQSKINSSLAEKDL